MLVTKSQQVHFANERLDFFVRPLFFFICDDLAFFIFNVGKKLVTVSCAVRPKLHRHHIEVTLWSTAFHDYFQSTFTLVNKSFVFGFWNLFEETRTAGIQTSNKTWNIIIIGISVKWCCCLFLCLFFCCLFFFVQSCYKELIRKVLETFKPGRFLMTLFANEVCVIIPYAVYLGYNTSRF